MSDFPFHSLETAEGETKEILQQVTSAYGFVPNLFAYMAEAPTTLKAYLQLNELLQQTSFTGGQLQVMLLSLSVYHKCDFCSDAHQAMAVKFKANPASIASVVKGEPITDEKDAVLAETVVTVAEQRGWIEPDVLARFYDAGFTQQQYLELVLVVTIKVLSNYINHQTLPETNPELLGMING